jgi:hypothetical protein
MAGTVEGAVAKVTARGWWEGKSRMHGLSLLTRHKRMLELVALLEYCTYQKGNGIDRERYTWRTGWKG